MTLNSVTEDFIARLRGVLPEAAFREVMPSYLEEPRGRWQGQTWAHGRVRVCPCARACAFARVRAR